jgi:hypothetical protein
MEKKQITLTIKEWREILGWCETYYSEPETEKEKAEYDFYWKTIEKLKKKIQK